MRNLKKVLSLTLALVMLLGMMVVGAGAVETSFADNGKITDAYKEAITVMNALKIIEGKGENTFDPAGTLKRGEAAKVLVVMTMGNKAADAMKSQTKSAVFADMADHWAAGLVDACYSLGIVKGRDDNTYDPEGTLTGTEFAAMLLRAVGVEGEFTGTAWEANVRVAAAKAGLSNVSSADLPREAAAQMAFEGLIYGPDGEKIVYTTSDGKSFSSAADAYFYQQTQNEGLEPEDEGYVTVEMNTTYPGSLGEKVFGLSKNDSATDDFGRPATGYTADKFDLDLTIPNVATKIYEGPVTNKTVRADVGSAALKYTWTGSVDGKDTAVSRPGTSGSFADSARGTVTELFVDSDAKTVKVVITNTYVGSVTRVTPAKGENKRTVTVTGNKTFATEDFAKDDVVLYTMADDEIQTMQLAEEVNGKLEKKVVGSDLDKHTYTVDGITYKWSAKAAATDIAQNKIGSEVVLYVDTQGNIVKVGTVSQQADQYIYILANPSAKENPDYITGVKDVVEVYGVLADGTVGKYTVKSVISTLKINTSTGDIDGTSGTNTDVQCVVDSNPSNAGTKTNSAVTAADSTYSKYVAKSGLADKVYKYTTDSNGYLTLTKAISENKGTSNAITSETRKIGSYTLNSSTVFVFVETSGGENKTVKNVEVKTGVANIGAGIAAGQDAFIVDKSNVAQVVFVNNAFDAGTGDTGTLVYVTNVSTVQTSTSTTTYVVDGVTEDGEEITGAECKSAVNEDEIWTLDDDGNLKSKKTGSAFEVKDIYEINGNNVRFEGTDSNTNRLYLANDTKVVDMTGDADTLAVGQRAILVAETATGKTGDIRVAFIVEAANETTVTPSGDNVKVIETPVLAEGTNKPTAKVKTEVTVDNGTSFKLPEGTTAITNDTAVKINDNVITDWGDVDDVMGFTFSIDKTADKDKYFKFVLKDSSGSPVSITGSADVTQCGGKVSTGVFYFDITSNPNLSDGTYFWSVMISDSTSDGDYNTEVAHGNFKIGD